MKETWSRSQNDTKRKTKRKKKLEQISCFRKLLQGCLSCIDESLWMHVDQTNPKDFISISNVVCSRLCRRNGPENMFITLIPPCHVLFNATVKKGRKCRPRLDLNNRDTEEFFWFFMTLLLVRRYKNQKANLSISKTKKENIIDDLPHSELLTLIIK